MCIICVAHVGTLYARTTRVHVLCMYPVFPSTADVFGREPHYSVLSPSRQSIVSTHNSYKGPSVVELLGYVVYIF